MEVLVIGGGGREHALAWRIAQSADVGRVWVAPGNAGTALEPGMENVAISPMDFDGLMAFARASGVDLTVVGPEAPLVAGVVDRFREAGLRCFGPSQPAARLEGSKSFAKHFLTKHGIPTAAWRAFDDPARASQYLSSLTPPIVIKADGLAAGKGVVLAQSRREAQAVARELLSGAVLAGAGARIVVEEFLEGEEASFIVMADGEHFLPFATSQDHKAAYDGDQGPNTGGMGAYSPAPVVTPAVNRRIIDEIIAPTIEGMKQEGQGYTGFLYAGLMIDAAGNPKVIEFNCRFGDPEAQPIMYRLQTDLVALMQAAIDGNLSAMDIAFDDRPALAVVMASGGYPGSYDSGKPIAGLDEVADVKVFHAGTRLAHDRVVTAGGRVLGVTAFGASVADARKRVYDAIGRIDFDGAVWRTDIGYRALSRQGGP